MNATLALSELAGNVGVTISAADDAVSISNKIRSAFSAGQPVELSEQIAGVVRTARDGRISVLAERGLTPAIANRMVARFCTDELSLADDDAFEFALELVRDVMEMKSLKLAEQTKAQMETDAANQPPSWADQTKAMTPV